MTFSGAFEDELFAIVRIDSSLTRITGVLDLIPSPRWLDYTFEGAAAWGTVAFVLVAGSVEGAGAGCPRVLRPQRMAIRQAALGGSA